MAHVIMEQEIHLGPASFLLTEYAQPHFLDVKLATGRGWASIGSVRPNGTVVVRPASKGGVAIDSAAKRGYLRQIAAGIVWDKRRHVGGGKRKATPRARRVGEATRSYNFVVYAEPRVTSAGKLGQFGALAEAKAFAKALPHWGAGVYDVSKGRFVGTITRTGRYSPTSRGSGLRSVGKSWPDRWRTTSEHPEFPIVRARLKRTRAGFTIEGLLKRAYGRRWEVVEIERAKTPATARHLRDAMAERLGRQAGARQVWTD